MPPRKRAARPRSDTIGYWGKAAQGTLWKFRRDHGYQAGMVWNPHAATACPEQAGCKKPHGAYEWPTTRTG